MPSIPTRLDIPSNEDDFEVLCLKLLRVRWKRPQLQQYGKRGERQHGIDLLDTSGTTPLLAAQCKLHESHKTIPPQEIETEVEKALTFPLPLHQYTILTTARVSTQAQNKVIEINLKHESLGLFTVELLHWKQIEQMLQDFPDLRDEIYGGIGAAQASRMEQQLTDLHLAVKSIPLEERGSSTSGSADEGLLDEAKAHIEQHEYQLARLLLQRLKKERWDALTPRLRFRLLSNIGAVNLNEGQLKEAAKCFLEAKVFQPEDEKALTNEVLAYFILGRSAEAYELAESLRIRFPESAEILSFWIQSAPAGVSHVELGSNLAERFIAHSGVAVSLAIRALQGRDFGYAEKVLRQIRTGKRNWSTVPGLLGRAILGWELHNNITVEATSTPEDRINRLHEAEGFFSEAVEFGTAEKQPHAVASALLDRAHVRTLLRLASSATKDIEEAYRLTPEDPSVLAAFAESKQLQGDLDSALLLIRGALQSSPRVDLQYQLAAVLRLRGKPGDYREAAELAMQLARQPQLPVTGLDHACMVAVDCLCRDERFEEAQEFLESVPAAALTPSFFNTIQGRVHFIKNDSENANISANSALSEITAATTRDALDSLARLLSDLGRHGEALPIWQKVVRPGELGTDPRRLLDTAYRLKRHDIILDTCERLRKADAFSPDLLQYEVAVLEQYDPSEAIQLLQHQLTLNPGDRLTQLHISMIASRIGREELVVSDLARMPSPESVSPFFGAVAVQIMKSKGHPDDALKYAYELLRLHFDDPVAHRAYQFVLLPLGPIAPIEEHGLAQVGSAVSVEEEGPGGTRVFVIEDFPIDGCRFNDEIAPNSFLAAQLIGRREGDEIVLAKGSVADREGKITKILNKFVYRYQESMTNWQIRFPDDHGFESIPIPNKPDDTPDITVLLEMLDRKQEGAEQMKQMYYAKAIPIHMFAKQLGNNAFQGMCMLAAQEDFTIDCSLGSQEEQADALANIRICSEIVLEMTAIATIGLLNLELFLPNLGMQLLVSQATITEMTEMIARAEMETGEGGHFFKFGDQYTYQERSAEDQQKHVRRLKTLLSVVQSSARIVSGRDAVMLDPSRRDLIDSAFGRYGTETILLAGAAGRVLWTDDHRMAGFAAGEHGVRRVWTQLVLQHCIETGKISQEDYASASAKLIGFEYAFTSLNPDVLMSAARIAEWDVQRWPLKQAMSQLASGLIGLTLLLRIAILFAIRLYREPIPVESRDAVFSGILGSLAVKPGAIVAFQTLRGSLPGLFGMNVMGGQQATECIRRWLEGHNFTQGLNG
jgi:tetratricopeptide (TPR) repeat protein